MKNKSRCPWCLSDPLYIQYHDREWGVPVHHDRKLFEFLILEGAQAGLSWFTVLKKRQNYRKAFEGFDAVKIIRYGSSEIKKLMKNAGIIRNRLKIESTISNAKAYLAVKKEFGSFDRYLWSFVSGQPIVKGIKAMKHLPPHTEISDALSKDLKNRGFRFIGSTICYALMQAVGMVNDHLTTCFRYRELCQKIK